MTDKPQPRGGVQVIARAADVLRALEGEPGGLSLAQIAARVGLARSTVHRLVVALADEQLLSPAGPQGRVRLGPGLLRLGAASRRDLRDEMQPFIRALREELDETIDLCVLEGDVVRIIDHLPSSQFLRTVVDAGMTMPLHSNAAGKMFLADMAREDVESLLPARLDSLTSRTIRSRAALLDDLEIAARRGYAVSDGEHSEGVSAVASLVRDPQGPVASLGVIMPSSRFRDNEQEVGKLLLGASRRASAVLGGRPEGELVPLEPASD